MYILQNNHQKKSGSHPTQHTVTSCFFFSCDENFNLYSLSNFQIYNTVVLTIVSRLSITVLCLVHFITASLYPWRTFTHGSFRLEKQKGQKQRVIYKLPDWTRKVHACVSYADCPALSVPRLCHPVHHYES